LKESLVGFASVPTYWWRRRGTGFVLEQCNEAAMEISEVGAPCVVGRPAEDLLPQAPSLLEDLDRCARAGGVLVRQGASCDLLYTFVPPDLVTLHMLDGTPARDGRSRILMEHLSDGICITKDNGVIVHANAAFCAMLGRPLEEVVGLRASEWLDAAAGQGSHEAPGGVPEAAWAQQRVRQPSGADVDVEVGCGRIEPGLCLLIVRDVSARRRAEAAQRATEKRLQRLLKNAPVIVGAVDSDGVVTQLEGRGLSALGVAPGEAEGRRLSDVRGELRAVHAIVERVLTGEIFSGSLDLRGVILDAHVSPERDGSGRITGAIGVALDVTAWRRALHELRASEERFRQFGANVQEGFWIAKPDLSEVVYVNSAFRHLLGWNEDSSVSIDEWLASVHPDDRDRMSELLRHRDPLEEEAAHNCRIVRPDGAVRWIRTQSFVIRDDRERPTYVAGVVEDTTEARDIENQVRRIQDRLADAQRLAHVGNWDWDISVGEVWGSEELYRILGLVEQSGALPFNGFFAAVHVDDRLAFGEALNACHAHGSLLDIVHRIRRPDGTVRSVRSRGEVTFGASGRPVRMIGTLQDITESQEAERTLAMLSNAVAQTADLVFITDRDGQIQYVNPAFEAHTGHAGADVLGATPRILKSSETPAEEHERLWSTIAAGHVYRGTVANRKRDGETFYEEKTITPIRDTLGRITHFVSVGRDITERRRTEEVQRQLQERLQRSADEWKGTFDAVGSPILILDDASAVKRLNRAARDLWGAPFETIVGSQVASRRGEPWATIASVVESVRKRGTVVSLAAEDRATGKTWDVLASPLQEASGTDVIILVNDVSPVVALQVSLRQSERMSAMGALVAGVAHEVRNPLFGISAALDAFESEFADRPEYREYSSRLRSDVGRLTALMQDLLEYGRPSATHLVHGSIEEVVLRAVKSCLPVARKRGVNVATSIERGLPWVMLEPGRLVQVFQNLVENAVQHSPHGGNVLVELQRTSEGPTGEVRCSILDSGPGFREEDLPRVFEPFFTRRRGGTGLGLSIVQKIVSEHGGTISLANRGEGGAAAVLTFPVAAGPEQPA
jgi:PAS domain S-box-containing protein